MSHKRHRQVYPRTFICPDCASVLEPSEIGEHEGDRCADCAKEAARYQTQADPQFLSESQTES